MVGNQGTWNGGVICTRFRFLDNDMIFLFHMLMWYMCIVCNR
jgi:hypothetical protein